MDRFFAVAAAFLILPAGVFANLVWPTESKDFALGKSPETFLQPTVSGNPMSGAFGDVRNNGTRFHEGIDIKPVRRDRKGEPLDDVYCAMDGKVRMINKIAGNSGYGRYVVVSHENFDVEVYTLYAHLAEIDSGIAIGSNIKAGARIGKMGRSASYSIARAQAHLHFEIGLRLSDSFNSWYKTKRYKQKNFLRVNDLDKAREAVGWDCNWCWNLWCRKYTLWGLLEIYKLNKDPAVLETAKRATDQYISMLKSENVKICDTGTFVGTFR